MFEQNAREIVLNLGVGRITINNASDHELLMNQKEPKFGDKNMYCKGTHPTDE